MKTKAKGIHANFQTECPECKEPIFVTNGKPDPHECRTGDES
jgi:hypothetical protein